MNYPGFGASTGPARLARIPEAALAVYDALRARAGDHPIFLRANSFGTTVALHVAARRRVDGMILQSPPALRSLIVGEFDDVYGSLLAGAVAMQVPRALDSVSNGMLARCPAVFVMTAGDTYVDPPYQQMVIDAYAGPRRVVSLNVDHNPVFDENDRAAVEQAIQWLWDDAAARVAGGR